MNELTPEQRLFKNGLKQLDALDEIRKTRELSAAEIAKENKIKEVLFASVRKYGISLIHKMTQKYRIPNDCYADLCQDLAVIFYAKLRAYNPEKVTPTTYFVRYFKQVISSYLVENIHRLSQYDANNVLKVRRAINYYESRGISWTEEMISNKSELSPKVVHMTLIHSTISNYAQIDEAYNLQSHLKTPEEYITDKESQETLLRALLDSIDPDDLELLLLRLNLDGVKELPYEVVAKRCGLSVREVKQKVNGCICKLNQNKKLTQQFSQPTMKKYQTTLSIHEDTDSLMEQQMNDFLN